MGLLERLTLPDDRDSPFARALLMRGSSSDTSDEDGGASAEADRQPPGDAVDTGAAVRALLKEIHLQHDPGIVTPSHLFSILHRHLHVTSGAILVPEQGRNAFSPMATVGLDSTSRFRLRVPGSVMEKICYRTGAVMLSGMDLENLKPFLSAGEFSRRKRIAVLPFRYNREILAVLLVFDSPLLDLDLEVLDVLLAAFSERAGYLLFDGRQKPFSVARRVSILDTSHASPVIRRVQEHAIQEKRNLVLLLVSLFPVHEAIRHSHPHMDQGHLLRDLLGTCALLCAENYTLVHWGGDEFLLVGVSRPHLDVELLVHLLGNTLQQLFGISPITPLQFKALDPEQLLREI